MSIIRVLILGAATLISFGGASTAAADDVAVIVNKANLAVGALTMTQLRKIVLGQESKWPDGKKIAVLMTSGGQAERESTLKTVCGMSETDFTLHFMHASFNGASVDPPKAFGSGLLVRQAVAAAATAVGFIRASQLDDSVKVIAIEGSSPGQPAYKLKLK